MLMLTSECVRGELRGEREQFRPKPPEEPKEERIIIDKMPPSVHDEVLYYFIFMLCMRRLYTGGFTQLATNKVHIMLIKFLKSVIYM